MKKQYLLYSLLLMLLVAGCKKTYVDNNKPNPGPSNGGGKTTPTGPVLSAQLTGFKINGASCAYDSSQNTFYYPVAIGTQLTSYSVTFDTILTKAIFLDGTRVLSGSTVSFSLKADQEIHIQAVNSLNAVTNY